MEFEKLFQVLVVGGSVLASGCAAKSNAVAPTPASTEPSETASESPITASKPPVSTDTQTVAKTEVECAKVCDYSAGEGRETLCPDETMDGAENCCWLMSVRHECCP